ncbi:hypothetical protein KSP39_PZI019307 [Platanthera zijinensis]|uniref:Uncharacterized protein n=1 Tax=Platanthera zijinensis TaxID=2320716 RepID=A0AAP0B220_9ASPA
MPAAVVQREKEAQLSKKRFREQAKLKLDFEQWSPTSRNIILTAWKAMKDNMHDRGKWYYEQEWSKYQERQDVIFQFRRDLKAGKIPANSVEPSKYFPKPFHYFERQKIKVEELKKKDQKGKKLADDSEANVQAKIQPGKGILPGLLHQTYSVKVLTQSSLPKDLSSSSIENTSSLPLRRRRKEDEKLAHVDIMRCSAKRFLTGRLEKLTGRVGLASVLGERELAREPCRAGCE